MIDPKFLNNLKRFHLIINKKVTSNYSGERRSSATGKGLIIKDYRPYVPGDDIRTVDWKIFARTDRLHVKQYEEDKNLTVHVIVDSSASMNFGKNIKKFDYAAMLGIGFAYLTMRDNEKFEFSTFSNQLYPFRPRRGMKQLALMIEHLNNLQVKGLSNFGKVMMHYKNFIKTRSMIVILSDFLYDVETIKKSLARFGKHDLKVIQILDDMERKMDVEGNVKLHDSETDDVLKTFFSRRMKEKYLKNFTHHNSEIKNICNHLNADFYSVSTNKPIFDTFYDVLKN